MALETLKGINEIGGFNVVIMDELREKFPDKFNESGSMDYKWFEKDIRPNSFIYVRNDVNSISFTIQNGPIKEIGVNGCQVETLICAAKKIYEGFQAMGTTHPLTDKMIEHCQAILDLTAQRTREREARGVEGTNKV